MLQAVQTIEKYNSLRRMPQQTSNIVVFFDGATSSSKAGTSQPHVWYSRGSSLGEVATVNQRLSRGGLRPRLLTACLCP